MRRAHAPSLYAASADHAPAYPSLTGQTTADVAIIGGGYTGLSAALHLAEAGRAVVLVEANSVGWGASGRNGGQLHSGQRRDQDWLEAKLGRDEARRLWRLGEEAKALTLGLIARHRIDCDWRLGLIEAVHKPRLISHEKAYVAKLRDDYGYQAVEWIDREELSARIGTDRYYGGRVDHGAGHLNPLKFARGLARAAASAGARIFEGARVTKVSKERGWTLTTETGSVTAASVVLAGNGYLAGIDSETEARAMPIDNYILATAPIGAGKPGGLIPGGEAVSDTRFVVYYFRPSPEGRLIFGGGESYARRERTDVVPFVTGHLLKIYPQLTGTRIDYGWGGRLAITIPRLPFIGEVRPGLYAAGGYSGQGVSMAPFAGRIIADSICGDSSRLAMFAGVKIPPFPGGRLLRYPAMVAGMTWYALRDRL